MKKTIKHIAVSVLLCTTGTTQAQWLVGGNALGSAGNLGSTTNQHVNFITNNVNRMTLTNTGLLGIGTATPAFILDVQTSGNASASFKSGTGTANLIIDRGNATATSSVSYRTAGTPTWQTGTLGTNNFSIRNIALAAPAMVVNAANNYIGIGTNAPLCLLDLRGSGSYNLNAGLGDFRLGGDTYNIKMGVANAGGGAGDGYIAASHRLYLGTSNTFETTQTVSINSDGRVGIATFAPLAKLHVVGDTGSAVTTSTIYSQTSYTGNLDVNGVYVNSVTNPGWGIGGNFSGGFIGVHAYAAGGTYAGTTYAVRANSTGSAGTRIGVYGTASGGTVDNWGGYFDTKVYASEIRVGHVVGATGYTASIKGKLIAEEVRIALVSAWPDYVFDPSYNVMSIADLEKSISTNKRLPGMPSACDVEAEGVDVGKTQTQIVEKLEESYLYIIQLQNQINDLKAEINEMKNPKR